MIPIVLLLLIIAVAIFVWATKTGQYDDMDSPAWDVVLDDDRKPPV